MVLSQQPGVRRWSVPRASWWPLLVAVALVAGVVGVLVSAGHDEAPPASSSRGSGVSTTDRREVPRFSSVELAGANTVNVHVGAPLSVAVTGDDNLVGRVSTVVRSGRLMIGNTGDFTTKAPMRVAVSAPSLDAVALGGAGTLKVDGVTSDEFTAELMGAGTLVVSGTAQRTTAVLAGTGTLDLHELVAADATAQLQGTGTIRVNATSTLDATLTGTGTIVYRGDPVVTTHNTGTGTVARG